jgi:streptomycin 6-kinase
MRNEAMCINAAARVASRAVVVRRRQIHVVVIATTVVSAAWTRMDGQCASVRHSILVGIVVCNSH